MQRSHLAIIAGSIAFGAASFWAGTRWSDSSSGRARNPGGRRGVESAVVTDAKSAARATAPAPNALRQFTDRFALDSGTPLTPERMTEAVQLALRETNLLRRHQLIARLMENLTAENAGAAFAAIRAAGDDDELEQYMEMVAWSWGTVDPNAAMARVGADPRRDDLQNFVLSAWAGRSPGDAIAWLEKSGKEWRYAGVLVEGFARRDPDAAFKYAQTLTSPIGKREAGDVLARDAISRGPEKAVEWMGTVTDPDMKEGAFNHMAEHFQRNDLTKAMEFVKPYANDPFAEKMIGQIAEAAGHEDVTKGLAFATSLKGAAQSKALGEVIGEWMERNDGKETLQASEYVSNLPPEIDRDHAAWAISNRMVEDDASAAIAWAQSVKNPDLRQAALYDVARSYRKLQPEAFAQWLPQSGLTEALQSKLRGQ